MAKIPQYTRSVAPQNTPYEYITSNANPEAFGVGVSSAVNNLGKAVSGFADTITELKNQYDRTKVVELSNYLDQWTEDTLYNKENGYLYKTGKDAMGKTPEMLNNYDKYADELISKYGFMGINEAQARDIIQKRRINLAKQISQHDRNETDRWQATVYSDKLTNIFNNAIKSRNNPQDLDMFLKDGITVLDNFALIKGWNNDPEMLSIKRKEFEAAFHGQVLDAYLAEGSLKAGEYFEKYKDKFSPDMQNKYTQKIHSEEINYKARATAENLFASCPSEEEALRRAEEIEDINLSDNVAQRLRQKYSQERRLKEQQQSDLINKYIDNSVQKIKQGVLVTEDDIPQGLDGKHYLQAKEQLNYFNKFGDVQTDAETYTQLWYTSNYDAQRFKDMDLSLYRLSLSDKDYRDLAKRQQEIQKGDYFTTLTDTSAVKNYIQTVTGISGKNEIKVFGQYQNMIREHELRTGRKVTALEKEQILKYIGSDKNNFKKIQNAMKDNADFYKVLSNNISYYQARHNGDMPDTETVNKWIKEQSIEYKKGKYQTLKNNALQNTKKIVNEQITLTNFADNYVPSLSQKIGIELNVTSRYRPSNGRYASKHSEGRALDIGYTTKDGKQLTFNQKFEMIEDIIQRPDVEKIAISSKDTDGRALLNAVMKKYGKKYGSKIQDMNRKDSNGKTRDENLGTNHTNHLHITLYKDNTFGGNDIIAIRNQLKNRGYNSSQIDEYLKQKGII